MKNLFLYASLFLNLGISYFGYVENMYLISLFTAFFSGIIFFMLIWSVKKDKSDEKLECENFYNMLSEYRFLNINNQSRVIAKFEDIKKWIRDNYKM